MANTLLAQRYELRHLLGRGGMAYVYRAYDHVLERPVAVKILRAEYARNDQFRERFRQEATAAARLSHPNIVAVFDFGYDEEHDSLFIVMEYVPGETLKTIIDTHAPLPIDEALNLAIQACAGLGYAHRVGLVHCDVKPQNLLIMPDGRLKVADFGIARALATTQTETPAHVVWGSPRYFSPEQATGKPPVAASDVYSLGVVLYEMLTGHLPFLADDPQELVRLHRDAPPVPPSVYRPDLPEKLEQIILTTLSKEPSRRYRTADQLGRVLLAFRENTTSAEPDTASPPARPAPETAEAAPTETPSAFPEDEPLAEFDWLTAILALLALIAVGGLIPLWMWVFLAYHGLR